MDIGEKIKRLRVSNQLTLEELANRSELTKGFLSQVERNLTSPSISTLEDILEALGTNLRDFFNEKQDEQIVFSSKDYFIHEGEDHLISYIVPNAQKNQMEPILLTLNKNGSSQVIEPHEGEEFGYILSGKILLHYGQQEFIVKKGQTFYIKGDRRHFMTNPYEGAAKVIWVSTPPSF